MVSRLVRVAFEHRSFHSNAARFISSHNYQPLDGISLIDSIRSLHRESLSAGYDERYKCQHRPFFTPTQTRDLIDELIQAQLLVFQSERGRESIEALMASAEKAMGRHFKPSKERERSAARRDVVRTAVCHAVVEAADAVLNAVFADRISVRARAASKDGSHG
jgi:hypothetical protein